MNTVELLTKARYCALGAVNKIADVQQKYYLPKRDGTPAERAVFFLENAISGALPNPLGRDLNDYSFDVIDVNDTYGKKAVLQVFDRAIQNAKRRHLSKTPMVFE